MTEAQKRVAATIATDKRFRDKPFDWSKQATCVHLMRFHAAQMGHDMPIVPRFRSALGAKKALKGLGYDNLPDLLDYYFTPIPPAFMRVGDLMAVDGEQGWHSILIKGDKRKFLGWHEVADGCTIIDVDMSTSEKAWRL